MKARYEFIDKQQHEHPVNPLCRALQVSRSGYYDWRKQATAPRTDPLAS